MQGFSSAVHDYVCLGVDRLQSLRSNPAEKLLFAPLVACPPPFRASSPKLARQSALRSCAYPSRTATCRFPITKSAPFSILPLPSRYANLLAAS